MSTAKNHLESPGGRETPVPRSGTYRRVRPGESLADYRKEHDDIRAWLDKLQTPDAVQLRVLLLGFRSVLLLHFANEEGPEGLFGLARERRGQDHLVEALRLQHHEMLTRIHRLQAVMRGAAELTDKAATLRDELVELVSGHERKETALLQELLLTDLGEGF